MEELEVLSTKKSFKEAFKALFIKKFNIYALLQMLVSIVLFSIMIYFVVPEIAKSINALKELHANPDEEIMGYHLLYYSRAIIFLFMFIFQILYSIYGIFVLFKYHNERQVFKIIFRSIFYISSVLLFHYIVTFFIFLVLPVTNIWGILSLIFSIFILEVALGGRLVSNFLVFTPTLTVRKRTALITLVIFMFVCIFFLSGDLSSPDGVNISGTIFFSLELLSSIFAFIVTIYFNDPTAIQFEAEPKIKDEAKAIEIDIPTNLTEIKEHQFSKNTRLTKITIPEGVKEIGIGSFSNCLRANKLYLPNTIEKIDYNAFFNCINLRVITYNGTKEEFAKIQLKNNCFTKIKATIVNCNDGAIAINN